MHKVRSLFLALLALLVTASSAMAEAGSYVAGVEVDSDSALALAGIVVAGLATMWGVRKVIKLINRS